MSQALVDWPTIGVRAVSASHFLKKVASYDSVLLAIVSSNTLYHRCQTQLSNPYRACSLGDTIAFIRQPSTVNKPNKNGVAPSKINAGEYSHGNIVGYRTLRQSLEYYCINTTEVNVHKTPRHVFTYRSVVSLSFNSYPIRQSFSNKRGKIQR